MKDILEEIRQQARALQQTQIGWRRHLHQQPELSNQEHDTTEFLRKQLTKYGAKFLPTKTDTGLLVELAGNTTGPTVVIRSDIDALPITEQTDLPFKSRRPGCMHACGHDVHMATVLGTVAVLSKLHSRLRGKVRFIFQPAEEMPPGGARPMIASGALKDASVIFGMHVEPHLATGRISLRDGAAMASVYDFDLTILGKTGHAARPHFTVDGIAVAAEIVDSVQKIVSRETDPIDPVVITFGQIRGGTARNVIADRVEMIGTARTLSVQAAKKVPALIKRTVDGIAKARGAKCELQEVARYPVLRNDARVNKHLAAAYDELFGKGKVETTPPVLGGEDFACYLEHVPGAMFRLGVMNNKIHANQPWHSPRFIADEQAMFYGTSLLAAAAVRYAEGWKP